MPKLEDLSDALSEKLQKIADDNNALILNFIAPDDVIRVSPASYSSASISVPDIYRLEKTIENLKKEGDLPETLHLIIHTPGGSLSTTFKIAIFLRDNFKNIHVFVPYEAASGGTLMCLGANKITLGDFGNLTPIDPQVRYKDTWVSAFRLISAVQDFEQKFGKTPPHDISPPWQQMAEKFDPILYAEMNTAVFQSSAYANRLLKKSGYSEEDSINIAIQLARTPYTHEHCINKEEAKSIGLNISNASKDLDLLSIYKKWTSNRLKEKVDYHIIEPFVPVKTTKKDFKAQDSNAKIMINKPTIKQTKHA